MAIIRIGSRLRSFIEGTEPDPVEDPDLYELVDFVQGHPLYPAGIELPEKYWDDVWYFADLLLSLDPDRAETRAANAALGDLREAGYVHP